jgi:hypothetical protein
VTTFVCPECHSYFEKEETLELHQVVHALRAIDARLYVLTRTVREGLAIVGVAVGVVAVAIILTGHL